jgi:serine protease AprX
MGSQGLETGVLRLAARPNPFTGTTTLSYSLPLSGKVSLRLYNVTGSLVTTVSQGSAGAGNYTTTLDATKLAKGIYVLKLVTENSSTTEKLVIE